MIKIILAGTLSCASISHAYDVQNIYDRIVAANPEVRVVPIIVKKGVLSWCSVACNTGKEIIIAEETLSIVSNEDELAGMIGHEEGHFTYKNEMQADLLGLQYAESAGYNYCKAAQIIKTYEGDDVHPTGAIRYKNTGCQ